MLTFHLFQESEVPSWQMLYEWVTRVCDGCIWLLAVLCFRLTRDQQASYIWGEFMSWKPPDSCTREWRCLEKYFQRWFGNPKLQDNQTTEQDTRYKTKGSTLSILLASSQLLHSVNITIKMGPVGALLELQLDSTPGVHPHFEQGCLSRLEFPYL